MFAKAILTYQALLLLCVPEEIYAVAVDLLVRVLLLALLVAVAVVAAERLRVHALETRTLYAKSERLERRVQFRRLYF